MLPLILQLYTRMKFSSNHSPQSQDHFFLVNQFQLRPCLHIYDIRLFTLTWIILHILTLNSIGWLFDQSDQLAGMKQADFCHCSWHWCPAGRLISWTAGKESGTPQVKQSLVMGEICKSYKDLIWNQIFIYLDKHCVLWKTFWHFLNDPFIHWCQGLFCIQNTPVATEMWFFPHFSEGNRQLCVFPIYKTFYMQMFVEYISLLRINFNWTIFVVKSVCF